MPKPLVQVGNALPAVSILPKAALRIKTGHPWVFQGEITHQPQLAPGAAVAVWAGRDVLGTGLYSTQSLLAVRMCSRVVEPVTALFVRRKLEDALRLRQRALGKLPQAYRWVHSEADDLPGLVVDRMGSQLSVQLNTQAMDVRWPLILKLLVELGNPSAVVLRNDAAVRTKEGLPLGKELAMGTSMPAVFLEGQVQLSVDLLHGQKTGTFLDQRDNHLLAGSLARGAALDCFSGDGGFALQMAARCSHVMAVDESAAAVERIGRNAAHNGFLNVEARAANAFEALRELDAAHQRFDTVVVDPPAFAKGAKALEGALRGYKELNLRALKMLRPGGLLVSCSCSQPVDAVAFDGMLAAAAADAKRTLQVIHRKGAGADHPVKPGFPESEYLKCVMAVVAP